MTNADQRERYLDEAVGDDQDLRQRIERMLTKEADSPANPLNRAVANLPLAALDVTVCSTINVNEHPMIGPYKLLEQIGEGGMGVVYVAEQTEPIRRKVALKIIKPGMDTKDVISRFEAERQALALMDHPNISKVMDAGATDSGRPYFVMELVNGIPITEYCDKAKLSTPQRLGLFIKVCRAIQHAHQKGIIHRDIKPSNVLITMMEAGPEPKVIDFGVAKAINQQLTEQTLYTAHSQMVGTPLYMSPEQAERTGFDIDTRSDVYSLGVLLYELLTDSTPFDQDTMKQAGFEVSLIGQFLRILGSASRVIRLNGLPNADACSNKKGSCHKRCREQCDLVPPSVLAKSIGRRGRTCLDRFVAQVAFDISRKRAG
jgi:serine/threonine protein kinase